MSGYDYGNTRLRAMRARLLDRRDYTEMMEAGSLDRMLGLLAETAYSSDVEAALVRARGLERLDLALRSNLAATLRRMATFYEGRQHDLVGLLLDRWDLRNLRALIRLTNLRAERSDRGRVLVPAGRIEDSDLGELAAQGSVASLVDLMVAWGIPSPDSAFALLRARAEFIADGDISHLEHAIDREYAAEMERVLSYEEDGAGVVLRAEIDARNLELALRLRAARLEGEPGWADAANGYLPGGTQPRELWAQVADASSPEAVAELAGTRNLLPGWRQVIAEWVAGGGLAQLSDGLQRSITSMARARFVSGDPLGFDIPVAYTFAKEAEVRNLSLIGRGLVHRIPMTEVEANLEVAA